MGGRAPIRLSISHPAEAVMRRVRVFLVRFGLLVVGSALGSAHAALLGEDDLADVVRKPAIGLYKGYAEFKMAHYAEARQIWMALAERGMGEAWFNLGILAEDGLGEARDGAEARRRYGLKVPVLLMDGELVCHGRLDPGELRKALAAGR